MNPGEKDRTILKKPLGIGIAALGALATIALAVVAGPDLWRFFSNGEAMQAWANSLGPAAPLAIAGLVAVQIVIAVLPGEPVELAAGYMLGFWTGTVSCLAGGLVGTLLVTAFVKTLGMKAVGLFFSQDQIDSVSWLQGSKRFEIAMFAVFLIPGTPKDILTYIAGLTKTPWWKIAVITTVGRIPSIVTSTLAASCAAKGDWGTTAIVAGITIAVAGLGTAWYAIYSKRKNRDRSHGMGKRSQKVERAKAKSLWPAFGKLGFGQEN